VFGEQPLGVTLVLSSDEFMPQRNQGVLNVGKIAGVVLNDQSFCCQGEILWHWLTISSSGCGE
jgi:hypothetical protein